MTTGLPDKIAKPVHEKLIGRNTKREKITAELYYQYLKTLVKIKAWKINQRHEAPIKPLELIYVDPDKLYNRYNSNPSSKNILPSIVGGDWDLSYRDGIKDSPRLKAIQSYIDRNQKWEETEYYKNQKQRFEKNESQWGANTKDSLDQKFGRLESLIDSIKEQGYGKQRELPNDKPKVNDKIDHLLKEFNEIKVHIGREGQFLLASGGHRTTIARALNINKIPVRIVCRHSLWQQKRDKIKKTKNLPDDLENHRDLQNLI